MSRLNGKNKIWRNGITISEEKYVKKNLTARDKNRDWSGKKKKPSKQTHRARGAG